MYVENIAKQKFKLPRVIDPTDTASILRSRNHLYIGLSACNRTLVAPKRRKPALLASETIKYRFCRMKIRSMKKIIFIEAEKPFKKFIYSWINEV